MRLNHPIFRRPLPVEIELTEKKTPDGYRKYHGGDELGQTLKVWKVHTGTFPKIDVGLVSTPSGFEDSPDAEVISSGINSKGPHSVALGRHGNFFLWGFFGDASMLTPSARRVFVNTVHYMKAFDGQTPLVRASEPAREAALSIPGFMKTYEQYHEYAKKRFSEGIQNRTKMDPDELATFLDENLKYLYASSRVFHLDEDARKLGVSNRSAEMLDAITTRLGADPDDPVGQRLLKRYVRPEGFASAGEFKSWLHQNREFLFFSDVGGYRWFVDTYARQDRMLLDTARKAVSLDPPTAGRKVAVSAALTPAKARAGESVTLIVRARLAPSWHIYAVDGPKGFLVPTSLDLKLPEGLRANGEWKLPKAVIHGTGEFLSWVYRGDVVFRRELRITKDVRPGKVGVSCTVRYQACDPSVCRPPTKVKLTATVEVVSD